MREKGQTEVAKTLGTPVFSRGIEILTEKQKLPIASGMKMIVSQEESGFSLKDLTVNDKKIDKEKEYSILLTDTTMSVLKKTNPKCEIDIVNIS